MAVRTLTVISSSKRVRGDRIGVDEPGQTSQIDGEGDELLLESIVQLTLEGPTIRVGGQRPGAGATPAGPRSRRRQSSMCLAPLNVVR